MNRYDARTYIKIIIFFLTSLFIFQYSAFALALDDCGGECNGPAECRECCFCFFSYCIPDPRKQAPDGMAGSGGNNCCGRNVLPPGMLCCNQKVYSENLEVCCDGVLYTKIEGKMCCTQEDIWEESRCVWECHEKYDAIKKKILEVEAEDKRIQERNLQIALKELNRQKKVKEQGCAANDPLKRERYLACMRGVRIWFGTTEEGIMIAHEMAMQAITMSTRWLLNKYEKEKSKCIDKCKIDCYNY